jgi:hypothetical protein
MGSTAFRAISRPLLLIGRALDGPLLPTVRPLSAYGSAVGIPLPATHTR